MNDKVLQAVIKLKDEISKPLKSVNEALKSTKKATESVTDSLDDNKKGMLTAKEAMKQYEKQQREAAKATEEHKKKVEQANSTFRKMGATLLTGAAAAIGYTTKKAVEFEYAMAEVGAISKATEEDLKKLTEEAKRLGASTKFSASEAAAGMQKYAMAGYDTEKIMSATSATLALAAAGNTDLALTCDIVSDAMTGLKLNAKETGDFVDIMTATITGSNTDIAMLGETMKYVAPVAGSLGVEFKDLALAAGLMGNAGVKASQAGTSIRGGLSRLIKPTKEVSAAMAKYGINLKKTDKGSLDLAGTIDELRSKMKDLDPVSRSAALAAIFGQEAFSGWAEIVTTTDKDFNKLKNSIANSAGEAERINEIYRNTAQGALTELGSALEGVAINIGNAFIPIMQEAANKLNAIATAFNNLDPALQQNVAKFLLITAAVGGVLLVLGLLAPIVTGVTMVIQALGVICGVVAAAFAFICTPVGAVIAAILAVHAAILVLKANWGKSMEQIKTDCKNAIDNIIAWWKNFTSIITAPIKAVVNIAKNVKETVTSSKSKNTSKKGQKSAWGTKRVVGNDVPYSLHDVERVLSRVEADIYDKGLDTQGINITVNGLTVREEADIDKIASAMVRKIKEAKLGYSGVIA